jgi:uncharacterized membrane protein
MKRYIYAFDTADSARAALERLEALGFEDEDITLIARADIQHDNIPDSLLDVSTDIVPAMGRGALFGSVTGLCAGVALSLVPVLGFVLAGPQLIAFGAGGALVGAWSSALAGSTVPNAIRRTFASEIDAGRTLLIVHSRHGNDRNILRAMSNRPNSHLLWQSDSSRATAA